VPPRLLARRLWHDVMQQEKLVLAFEASDGGPHPEGTACVRWAAVPETAGGGTTRLKFERKSVPLESLPRLPQALSDDVTLSGQWRAFLSDCLSKRRATPFRRCADSGRVMARAGRLDSRLFLEIEVSALGL